MRTLARKPAATPQGVPVTRANLARARAGHGPETILGLQRTIGNQAVQRMMHARMHGSPAHACACGGQCARCRHDHHPATVQPKLRVGQPGDRDEREADRVAERIVQPFAAVDVDRDRPKTSGMSPWLSSGPSRIAPGSNFGRPLDSQTRDEMTRKLGFDVSNVRVHTDELSAVLNKRLNARAFTHGSDIYFNDREYAPHSAGGKRLLAHELTHVGQQAGLGGHAPQRAIVQCTTIGQVLDEFFSSFSAETLWVMPERDNYTRIVRRWQPVIDAVNLVKADVAANCATWSASHRTDAAWKPGMTDPPVTDPNAFGHWVNSPPGTDPATCRNAFIIYVSTKSMPGVPTIQTFELYTCSIGSFGIYATVDSIDCPAQTARINIWMYNAMDRGSFGRFASHPLFALSGMERQYMWWNWHESHSWAPGATPGGGSSGGSSNW